MSDDVSTLAAQELTHRLAPGFDAETAALIEARQTLVVKRKLQKKFAQFLEDVEQREPFGEFTEHFKAAAEVAVQNPVVLYRFFQLYNYWNAGIAIVSC